jgi:hypothetical protein
MVYKICLIQMFFIELRYNVNILFEEKRKLIININIPQFI